MASAARNQAELGELLGVSQQAVSKLVKSAGWPVRKRGPWSAGDVRTVLEWHGSLRPQTHAEAGAALGGSDDAELNRALKQMRILLTKAQRDKAQLEVEVKRGQLVQRELLDISLGGLSNQFLLMIEQLRINLPKRFRGINRDELDDLLDAYLEKLANLTEIEARSVDDAVVEARRRASEDKAQEVRKSKRKRSKT